MSARARTDLAGILARSLGEDAARAHVDRVADALGLAAEITATEALAILEKLATEDGLTGIAARFAKARVHLAWEGAGPATRRA